MIYPHEIKGKFVTLKSITLEDAEFSYNLRKDPRFINIMGQSAKSLDAQREFIKWQQKQPGDYYFVVYNNKNEKIGLIGVYDIQGDCCEIGREINIGEPYETMEAHILLDDFCVEILHLSEVIGITYKINKTQLKLQKSLGFSPDKEFLRNGIPVFEFKRTFDQERKANEKARKIIESL